MSLQHVERAIAYIEQAPDADFAGPQTKTTIDRAEALLAVSFPATYRRFLARLGTVIVDGNEFYGIVSDALDAASVPNVVWITLEERKLADLPKSHVVIGHTGDGGIYVIDTSDRDAHGECPVLEWWSSHSEGRLKIAEDFGEFLWNTIQSGTVP